MNIQVTIHKVELIDRCCSDLLFDFIIDQKHNMVGDYEQIDNQLIFYQSINQQLDPNNTSPTIIIRTKHQNAANHQPFDDISIDLNYYLQNGVDGRVFQETVYLTKKGATVKLAQMVFNIRFKVPKRSKKTSKNSKNIINIVRNNDSQNKQNQENKENNCKTINKQNNNTSFSDDSFSFIEDVNRSMSKSKKKQEYHHIQCLKRNIQKQNSGQPVDLQPNRFHRQSVPTQQKQQTSSYSKQNIGEYHRQEMTNYYNRQNADTYQKQKNKDYYRQSINNNQKQDSNTHHNQNINSQQKQDMNINRYEKQNQNIFSNHRTRQSVFGCRTRNERNNSPSLNASLNSQQNIQSPLNRSIENNADSKVGYNQVSEQQYAQLQYQIQQKQLEIDSFKQCVLESNESLQQYKKLAQSICSLFNLPSDIQINEIENKVKDSLIENMNQIQEYERKINEQQYQNEKMNEVLRIITKR